MQQTQAEAEVGIIGAVTIPEPRLRITPRLRVGLTALDEESWATTGAYIEAVMEVVVDDATTIAVPSVPTFEFPSRPHPWTRDDAAREVVGWIRDQPEWILRSLQREDQSPEATRLDPLGVVRIVECRWHDEESSVLL